MTAAELTARAEAAAAWIRTGNGTNLDRYNPTLDPDVILHLAKRFDETGYRYHASSRMTLALIRYVLWLETELWLSRAWARTLEGEIAPKNESRAAGVDGEGENDIMSE